MGATMEHKKGGTPQSPQGGDKGGTPVPEGMRKQSPMGTFVAMGGAAKRQRAEGGAVKAT